MKRLRDLCNLKTATILNVTRRPGLSRQPKRLLESDVRGSVVRLTANIIEKGYTLSQAANFFHLCPRTLRQWQADTRQQLPHVHLMGRPLARATVGDRNLVIDLLDDLGPATGVPTLRTCFPSLARVELDDILKRYRRVWHKLNLELIHRLRWPIPGRVWAIDFSQAPSPIDGRFPYLLAVRDLASGQQLLWQPAVTLTARVAQDALAALFDWHGSPLVLKMDNGSAFIAEALQKLLRPEVTPLFSPPYYPRYNGAIEAGIGSLKPEPRHTQPAMDIPPTGPAMMSPPHKTTPTTMPVHADPVARLPTASGSNAHRSVTTNDKAFTRLYKGDDWRPDSNSPTRWTGT